MQFCTTCEAPKRSSRGRVEVESLVELLVMIRASWSKMFLIAKFFQGTLWARYTQAWSEGNKVIALTTTIQTYFSATVATLMYYVVRHGGLGSHAFCYSFNADADADADTDMCRNEFIFPLSGRRRQFLSGFAHLGAHMAGLAWEQLV